MKPLQYAYVGRRLKKRDFRQLWIARISAGCKLIKTNSFPDDVKNAGALNADVKRADLIGAVADELLGIAYCFFIYLNEFNGNSHNNPLCFILKILS